VQFNNLTIRKKSNLLVEMVAVANLFETDIIRPNLNYKNKNKIN
jgi:hypothetical protein